MTHSTATAVVAIGACFAADEFGGRESEFLVAGVIFVAAAAILAIWVPAMARAYRQPLLDAHEEINIHCPSCGYSLIGMRELRCPECGTEFRLDELIRAQDYELKRAPPTSEVPPSSTTPTRPEKSVEPPLYPAPRPADSC